MDDFIHIDVALHNATWHRRYYKEKAPIKALLDIVVTVYKEDATSTFQYAVERMEETWEGEIMKHPHFEDKDMRIRYLQNARGETVIFPIYKNCVRIELVDFGAKFSRKVSRCAKSWRGRKSATFAPIYAAALDPVWVAEMGNGGEEVEMPEAALCAGLQVGDNIWVNVPCIAGIDGRYVQLFSGNESGLKVTSVPEMIEQ